jgi:predicted metal-dependent enzyme (double-stranded beta helix superfamily)/ubiquinone/menaquinone biosynthesis C-methylase UbiE
MARAGKARLGIIILVLAVLGGCAAMRGGHGESAVSPAKQRYIDYLESDRRADWQMPEQVVHALRVSPGQTITDLGAGTGYFSRRFAAVVGPAGKVDAADIDPALLANLEQRADAAKIANIQVRRVARHDPAIAPESADLVFLCDTYSQLRDRVEYDRKIAPGLKPGGRVAVIDFHKSPDVPEGPALDEKIDRDTVVDEFRQAGFALEREETFLPYQYFLVFRATPEARSTTTASAVTSTTAPPNFSFAPLVQSIREVMRSDAPDRRKQRRLAALLRDYLEALRLEPRYQSPDPSLRVTTYLLYSDPDGLFSIAVLVFKPRAVTAIHDHQSWVVWGTYAGRERETRYRRTDVPGKSFPKLEPAWSKVFSPGDISVIDPPPGDVHEVANVTDDLSISIHVHATDIAKQARNVYDRKHQLVRSFVQTSGPAMPSLTTGNE